jgi:hypothetical protein
VAGDAAAYAGHDGHGVPHYATLALTTAQRAALRNAYGIEDPTRLFVSDSTSSGVLKYDTKRKTCRHCYVNSYRIGFVSLRRTDESWEQLERRVATMKPADFPPWARVEDISTTELDPAVRPEVDAMLRDAAQAGFTLHIAATYRSPEREAYLMALGHNRTHTLTSLHSYGRAIDVVVGDGNAQRSRTRAQWIAFRRWVTAYRGGEFHVIGAVDHTWDWSHIELPSADIGFASIEDALARARACTARPPTMSCDFEPHLPPSASHPAEP